MAVVRLSCNLLLGIPRNRCTLSSLSKLVELALVSHGLVSMVGSMSGALTIWAVSVMGWDNGVGVHDAKLNSPYL
jgi:hypothetical protein